MRVALIGLLLCFGLPGGPVLAQGMEGAGPPTGVVLQFPALRAGDWFALEDRPESLLPRRLTPEEMPARRALQPGQVYYLVAGPGNQRPDTLPAVPFYVPVPVQLPLGPIPVAIRPGESAFPVEIWRAALGNALPLEEERKARQVAARFVPPPAPAGPPGEPPPANVPAPRAEAAPPAPAQEPAIGPAHLAAVQEEVRQLRDQVEQVRQQGFLFGLIALALAVAALGTLAVWFFAGWLPHRRALAEFEDDLNRRLSNQASATADVVRQLEAVRRHVQAPSTASHPGPPPAGGPAAP